MPLLPHALARPSLSPAYSLQPEHAPMVTVPVAGGSAPGPAARPDPPRVISR
ncbi:hypothetical protein [Catenulispora acidiphila]|uniref:hypothetical protein n=1 Tax=Catenulispora acidiphila TaxID=304895 RepID=UPI001CC07519|nr:hypothetical protein [Catenulispora acidiphila]